MDDAVDKGSSVPRRMLGRHLKQAREQAGVPLQVAAKHMQWGRERMYRVERGETFVRTHDATALCGLYGVSDEMTRLLVDLAAQTKAKGWWRPYSDAIPPHLELYLGLEAAASRLRQFQAVLVPGLLQTREYAEAVFRTRPGVTEEAVERKVAVRMERQRLLGRRQPEPPALEIIIDEAVLRRPIADREGMRGQLARLAVIAQQPGVCIRVLPFDAGPHPASVVAEFVILEFASPGEPTTIYSDNITGSLYLDKPDEVAVYEQTWRSLDLLTLSPGESEDLIQAIMKENEGV